MSKPNVLIFSGYGLNCEEETKNAFELAGAKADIIHVNDLSGSNVLNNYQIIAMPGGFSYGDDTGSGNAYAIKIKSNMWTELLNFIQKDTLILGICNGFQILTNLGLLPAFENNYGERNVALLHNKTARYNVRWVDLKVENNSPWLRDIETLMLPIAHGEGKFYASDKVLNTLKEKNMIALRYVAGEISQYQMLEANPNGSIDDIAGITDETGRILGLMPHPDRATHFTQLPHWTYLKVKYRKENKKIPTSGPGLAVFQNAVNYFK